MPDVPGLVVPAALTPAACADLLNHFDANAARTLATTRGRVAAPPPEFVDRGWEFLVSIGRFFGLPVNNCRRQGMVEYGPGDYFPPHTDAQASEPETAQRTVAFTVLLTPPDAFTGGQLLVSGEVAELGQGDMAAFTANTWHEVTEVTSGRRVVWIGFGEFA